MNRRAFLLATFATLVLPATAHGGGVARFGTATRQFTPSDSTPDEFATLNVTVRRRGGLVAPLPTAGEILDANRAASHARAGIEYYIIDTQTLSAPDGLDMDSLFLTWTTLEGAAAVMRACGTAVLQRDSIRWTISVLDGETGSQADLLREVALIVSDLASEQDAGDGRSLLDLLPAETDVPAGWRLASERVTPEPCER